MEKTDHLKLVDGKAMDTPVESKGGPAGQEIKTEVVGIPLVKDKFIKLFDNPTEPNVMIFSVPIRALAMEDDGNSLAILIGKMEIFKGDAHKVYKSIAAEKASRGPQLVGVNGKPLPLSPEAHA